MYFDVEMPDTKPDWKTFEKEVMNIFDGFGYKTEWNIRFKTGRRFQIDVLAWDEYRCFIVDCKDHKYINPEKEELLSLAQKERTVNLLRVRPWLAGKKVFSLLVTRNKAASLLDHKEAGLKIMSLDAASLPETLRNIELYEDDLYRLA
jgi:Holliday junction resolvase